MYEFVFKGTPTLFDFSPFAPVPTPLTPFFLDRHVSSFRMGRIDSHFMFSYSYASWPVPSPLETENFLLR